MTNLWWLSFVDPSKSAPLAEQVPGGGGFLGVAIVEAGSLFDAVAKAHRLGINPGGEVQGLGPFESWRVGEQWRNRLLSAAEVDAMPCCGMHSELCAEAPRWCCDQCDAIGADAAQQ